MNGAVIMFILCVVGIVWAISAYRSETPNREAARKQREIKRAKEAVERENIRRSKKADQESIKRREHQRQESVDESLKVFVNSSPKYEKCDEGHTQLCYTKITNCDGKVRYRLFMSDGEVRDSGDCRCSEKVLVQCCLHNAYWVYNHLVNTYVGRQVLDEVSQYDILEGKRPIRINGLFSSNILGIEEVVVIDPNIIEADIIRMKER